jgi:hypothetical protein
VVHVLLDANAIGVDPPLGKIEHRVMLDAHRSGAIVLVIPHLALRESVGGWKRELTSRLDKLRNARQQLGKLVPSYEWNLPELNRHQAADDLLAELSRALTAAGVEMPGTPQADHEDLIDRALNRRQPFDQSGSGYRDALLWQITRECADQGNDVLLVSNDPAAFAQDRKKGMSLASSLADEIASEASVTLIANMREAIATLGLVAPEALDATEAVIERLGENFGKQLLDQITTDLIHPIHVWITRELVNPFIASDVSLGVPHELLHVAVEEARTRDDGDLEASILLKVRQWLTIYLPTPASKQFEGVGMIQAVDENFDSVEIDGVVEHRCSVVLNPMTDRIVSAEPQEAITATSAA